MNIAAALVKNGVTSEVAKPSFEKENTDTKLAVVERDAGSLQWPLMPRIRCYLCGKEILEGVFWCPRCHRPLAPIKKQWFGRPRLGDWIADSFRCIIRRMIEIGVKPRDLTVRLEKFYVDLWDGWDPGGA